MRNSRKAGLIGALALVAALVASTISFAGEASQSGVTQTADLTVKPSKLPKKGDGKDASLNVDVSITSDSPTDKVPSANRAQLWFDNAIKINTKGVPTCDEDTIATLNNAQAKSECKKALVGTGSASATCGPSENPPDIPGVKVNAFNGETGGKRAKTSGVLLLHTDANLGGTSTITILPGKLSGASGGRTLLDVEVPPLAGGACSIVDFETTVGKGEINKKYNDYITANCKDKRLDLETEFTYNSNPQGVSSLKPTDSQTCKQA